MTKQQKVYQVLNELSIPYTVTEHPPVVTIEEMDALKITEKGTVCKNLFVRDQKGKKHYLIILQKDKIADLTKLGVLIESGKLSFASPERLDKYLGLEKGAVSPLGIINDTEHQVVVVLDRDLKGITNLGFHPNDNTATVFFTYDDLLKLIAHYGNTLVNIRI